MLELIYLLDIILLEIALHSLFLILMPFSFKLQLVDLVPYLSGLTLFENADLLL